MDDTNQGAGSPPDEEPKRSAKKAPKRKLAPKAKASPKAAPKAKKNPHAVALGKRGGKVGGLARAKAMSAEERKASSTKAAEARWAIPKATHVGELKIGGTSLLCAVLKDGRRVLSQNGFNAAMGRRGRTHQKPHGGGFSPPPFLQANNLKPFLSAEIEAASVPIDFRSVGGKGVAGQAKGYRAELLPLVCNVYLEAREAGVLIKQQMHVARMAEILVRALATVGIIALIDEATGYQAERQRDALAQILEAFIAEELRPYIRMFPHEFFKQVHRLWDWPYKENSTHGPRYVGKIINKYIYARLPPGVLEELQRKNPTTKGQRKHAHHQWLTEETGIVTLDKQILAVTTLMVVSDDKAMFDVLVKKRFPKRGDQLDLLNPMSKYEEE